MSTIRGTVMNGQIVPNQPLGWPDGTELEIRPATEEYVGIGIREEDWPTTPEGIAEWLAWYNSLEPIVMTEAEEEEWKKVRAEQKAFQLASWDERCRKIEKMFE